MKAKHRRKAEKKKVIKCDVCKSTDVRHKGMVFGNWGKKQFECGSCGNYWQYGY